MSAIVRPETVEQVKQVLVGVLNDGTRPEDVAADADLIEHHGLDSLQMISFLLGIEDAFDVELDYENLQLDHLRSVSAFAAYVSEPARPSPAADTA